MPSKITNPGAFPNRRNVRLVALGSELLGARMMPAIACYLTTLLAVRGRRARFLGVQGIFAMPQEADAIECTVASRAALDKIDDPHSDWRGARRSDSCREAYSGPP